LLKSAHQVWLAARQRAGSHLAQQHCVCHFRSFRRQQHWVIYQSHMCTTEPVLGFCQQKPVSARHKA